MEFSHILELFSSFTVTDLVSTCGSVVSTGEYYNSCYFTPGTEPRNQSGGGGHPLLAICENRLIHMTSQTTCAHSSLQNLAKLHNFLTLESVIICLGDSNCSSNECML